MTSRFASVSSSSSSCSSSLTCFCLLLLMIRGISANNLALLSGTLRTFQRAACDTQLVALRCPPGTCISVQVAQYGSATHATQGLCASAGEAGLNAVQQQQQQTITQQRNATSCLWPKALQYSLLQTVVEACQKKRQCKFHTSPKTFGGDPCPGLRKYVEIAYKCRPYEFRSKVACENDVLQLKCNPNSRIAVYSASFGRTEYESVRCPQPQGVREETCLVSYATETVMQICHGKRRCTLSADASTFGNPCQKESRMYLKVVYTCVPRKVLREQYEDRLEDDEHLEGEYLDMDYDAVDDLFREPDSFSPSPNLAGNLSGLLPQRPSSPPPPSQPHKEDKLKGVDSRSAESYRRMAKDIQGDSESKSAESSRVINCTVTIYTNSRTRVIGFISEWINTYNFLTQNQEKLYLYLIVSVCFGLLSLLSLVIGRLLWQRHVTRRRLNKDGGPGVTTLPNGFADDISEIDADIDLTSVNVNSPAITILPAQGHSPSEVVRYAGSGDVTAPRSLSRSAVNSSQYYYG